MICKFDHNVFKVFTTINNLPVVKLCHSWQSFVDHFRSCTHPVDCSFPVPWFLLFIFYWVQYIIEYPFTLSFQHACFIFHWACRVYPCFQKFNKNKKLLILLTLGVKKFKQNMAAVPNKWKAVSLQEKHNIIQKVEANLNHAVFRWSFMTCVFLLIFLKH
jgi:hypothetical protein